ncbi:ArsC/Spx/MgsR family protein [Kaarinaea lacus]
MAEIIFYEKPGCINNTQQKKLLIESGHWVQAIDILRYRWTKDLLYKFFNKLPVSEWFNQSAPRVRDGVLKPDQCDVTTALELLVQEPLLIRRPLMQVGDQRMVGFDWQQVNQWVGLVNQSDADLETCPNTQ